MRRILPQRRHAETFTFEHAADAGMRPIRYTATVGRDASGRISEVFLNAAKLSTGSDSYARDAAIAVSIALQYGASIAVLRGAMTRNADGAPSSPIGALLDRLDDDGETELPSGVPPQAPPAMPAAAAVPVPAEALS